MKIFILILWYALFSNFSFGQSNTNAFQQRSLAELNRFFSSSTISKLKCDLFTIRGMGHDDNITGYPCDAIIDTNFNNLYYAFQYSFYSNQLQDTIYFVLSLDSGSLKTNSKIENQIPDCVRRDVQCKLISRDQAISVVNENGYLVKEENFISIEKNKKDKLFYWRIPAFKKTQISKKETSATFLINVVTGQILKRSKFEYSW